MPPGDQDALDGEPEVGDVGGAEDPFFPESYLRETAAAIPGACLQVVAGSGHGLPKHRGAQLQATVARFLG